MRYTSEQRIFVVTNYLRTTILKEVQQLLEQRFRDRVSPTKMNIWKKIKKYKTVGSSFNLNKGVAQVAGEQNVHSKTSIFFEKRFSRIQKYQPEKIVWTLVRV